MILTGNWSYPTQILFGKGRIKEISNLIKSHGNFSMKVIFMLHTNAMFLSIKID